ncbi:unnamed protein product [Somion occarium]|uniref:MYND-type domain-containing protein n=1 Tax=Somion occarium TaxID=3059160 RepID=A0ABP1DVC0_9APHY
MASHDGSDSNASEGGVPFDPELRALLEQMRDAPESIAPDLMKMHISRDELRIDMAHFLMKVLLDSITDEYWDAFLSSKLINVLFIIATDPFTYEDCNLIKRAMMYPTSVLTTLLRFCEYLGQHLHQRRHREHTHYFLRRCGKLFITLWHQRLCLLETENRAPGGMDYKNLVQMLTIQVSLLQRDVKGKPSPPIDGHIHLLLWRWSTVCLEDSELLLTHLNYAVRDAVMVASEPINRATREVLIDADYAMPFLQKVHSYLAQDEVVDDHLMSCFYILMTCLSTCAELVNLAWKSSYGRYNFLEVVALACQRQWCLGTHNAADVVFGGLTSICLMTNNAHDDDAHLSTMIRSVRVLDILPMICRFAATRPSEPNNHMSEIVTRLIYTQAGLQTRLQGDVSRTAMKFREDQRELMRKSWSPAMESFKASPPDQQDPRYQSYLSLQEIGRTLNMDEKSTETPYFPGYDTCIQSCHFADCLCSHKRPLHALRVCKGCWRVYYCGRSCQIADWRAGHREDC